VTAVNASPAAALLPRWWQRLPRRSIRLRLTMLYGGLFLACGSCLLAITYGLVRSRMPVTAGVSEAITGQAGTQAAGTCFFTSTGGSSITVAPPSSCAAYGRSLLDSQRTAELSQLFTDTGIALAIMTVVSIALGWLMAGRVLRPLRTITTAARYVSASSLHQRLAMTGPDDELKELGDTFDGLLGRLDAAFQAQRQFVANASHELRTPLARQRAVAEVALADPEPTVASLRNACERVLVAGEQQERLIEALLTLARSERGLDQREPLDLAEVTRAAAAARIDEAVARGVVLRTALGPAAALGDHRLAERLVANLLDNALRHNEPGGHAGPGGAAGPGGKAWLSTRTEDGHAILTVTNTGPPVPPEQVDRLFQPFQRLRAGRAAGRDGDGLGLGLPIVVAIAAAHGAWVRARPRPGGGLSIAVRFPRPPATAWPEWDGRLAAGTSLSGSPHPGAPGVVEARQRLVRLDENFLTSGRSVLD